MITITQVISNAQNMNNATEIEAQNNILMREFENLLEKQ